MHRRGARSVQRCAEHVPSWDEPDGRRDGPSSFSHCSAVTGAVDRDTEPLDPIRNSRRSLVQIVRITIAFTIGHSITLACGASGVVSIPDRTVEVLVPISIFVSAVHALHPIFPGCEPAIAAFFGLYTD